MFTYEPNRAVRRVLTRLAAIYPFISERKMSALKAAALCMLADAVTEDGDHLFVLELSIERRSMVVFSTSCCIDGRAHGKVEA